MENHLRVRKCQFEFYVYSLNSVLCIILHGWLRFPQYHLPDSVPRMDGALDIQNFNSRLLFWVTFCSDASQDQP